MSAPASFSQERLWFLHQMAPDSSAYNCEILIGLSGPLNAALLEDCVNQLIARHESLRTVFRLEGGRLLQEIADCMRIELSSSANAQPFDPAARPLIRAALRQSAETEHVLALTIHHLVTDGWSNQILLEELAVLYEAGCAGGPANLPSPPIRYADFAARQREEWRASEAHVAYWNAQLAGNLEPLNLPVDRPRGPVQTFHGARESASFPAELTASLKALSRRERSTLFMTLLASFQALLHRYTGQDDICVGSPIAGRTRTETERLVGCLMNTLVLRTDFSGDPTFREMLTRVRRVALEAYSHQHVPFEELVQILQPERDLSRNPLFDVLFQLRNMPKKELTIPGLRMAILDAGSTTAKVDLSMELTERPDGLFCMVEYDTALFDADTVRRMLGHYRSLLENAADSPDLRISQLPILTAAERRQLSEWNATAREYPPVCLHQLFEAQVERTPDAVAVEHETRRLTYRELNARSNQLAHYLRSQGVGPDVLVAVSIARSLELVVALYGILKAGGAYVPVDPDYPPERVAFMLQDSGAAILLTEAQLSGRDWPHDTSNPSITTTPDDLAYVIYTSGSTGQPKGAMNTHRGVTNRLLWMQDQYGLKPHDVVLQKTPFSFDVSVWEFFWPLLAGARLTLAQPGGHRDAAYLIDLITDRQVAIAHFVPSMLRVFLAQPGVERCTSLRHVIASGEALSFELQEEFFRLLPAQLHNLYGPTEAAVDVTHWTCRRGRQSTIVPIGRPVSNTQIHILDRHLQPAPIGVPGELHIGGVQVGRGYHNRPELTAQKFIPDPFSDRPEARLYKSGDLAHRLPDGNIEYLGRMDFQVKLRGLRIELGEIEAALERHPSVESAVAAVHDDRLIAYVVARDRSASDLRAFLKEILPEYMIPAAFVFLAALPLGPNGKLDRRALPAPELQSAPAAQTPRTPLEAAVAEIWTQSLGIADMTLDANFFELGGHSLMAARVLARIRETFDVEVKLRDFFEDPTVSGLARAISKTQAARLAAP